MFMKKLTQYQRPVSFILLPVLCMLLFRQPAHGQGDASDNLATKNVKWSLKDDLITINYDLTGSPSDKYAISIVMKKDNDRSVAIVPKSVEGDVGDGYFAGTDREIRWYFRNEYPQGFSAEGYYFEIHVQVVGRESNWMYYALGAAALAGGVVALIVGKGGGDTPPSSVELPMPPGRPQ